MSLVDSISIPELKKSPTNHALNYYYYYYFSEIIIIFIFMEELCKKMSERKWTYQVQVPAENDAPGIITIRVLGAVSDRVSSCVD